MRLRVLFPLALILASSLADAGAAGARLLVVSGVGGEDSYSAQFNQWSIAMLDAARDRLQLTPEDILWLCEAPRAASGRCSGESRRDAVLDAARQMASAPPGDAPLMVLLIGHGTAREGRALFNLPGPDLSPDDLDDALGTAGGRPVAVVNTTASSGPFLPGLSRVGRVVVSATAHAAEDDHTRFAGHFVAAWAGSEADADKNGRVSLLEAFRFAVHGVAREYTTQRQLVTEHATLDDNGDGRGVRDVDVVTGDGAAAAQFYLAALPAAVTDSPERMALEEQARDLVAQIAELRRARSAMDPQRYDEALESLLVKLALNRRAARNQGS